MFVSSSNKATRYNNWELRENSVCCLFSINQSSFPLIFFVPYICMRSVSRRLEKLQFSFVFPYFVEEKKKKETDASNYNSNIPPRESKFYISTFDEFYLV